MNISAYFFIHNVRNDSPGAVTVADGGGDSAPTGTTALLPRRPRPPLTIHALWTGAVRHTHPLVAPLRERRRRETYDRYSQIQGYPFHAFLI